MWPISAKTEQALRAQAERLHRWQHDHPESSPADVGHSLALTRTAFAHRAVIIARRHPDFTAGLAALVRDHAARNLVRGVARGLAKTVFVFPGQGSYWPGMAAELLDSVPAFRDKALACASALAPHVGWSLIDVLRDAPGAASADRVDVLQPTLFAMMVCLAELWQCAGVRPDAVIGHSQGEIAAAHVAGALSLEEAARVVALRSQALTAVAGAGAMVAMSAACAIAGPMASKAATSS